MTMPLLSFKLTVEELRPNYGPEKEDPQWSIVDHVQGGDRVTFGKALRAIADRYDPPKQSF